MPELPEVQTVLNGLEKTIAGHTITDVRVSRLARIFPNRNKFIKLLTGARFIDFRRRGKNLLIGLSNENTLWVHLRMTGHFYYLPADEPQDKHDHIIFELDGNNHNLRFNDYRRFGRLRIFPTAIIMKQKGLVELGPEPLEITAEQFVIMCRSKRRMIKPALLDQTFMAGIGNIYADESLYLSRINPRRNTDSIATRKLRELHGHIQNLLFKAIANMGTSVDTFAGVNKSPGGFQKYLVVYGREGEPCGRCGREIVREKIGSRSAHFCPRCQRP